MRTSAQTTFRAGLLNLIIKCTSNLEAIFTGTLLLMLVGWCGRWLQDPRSHWVGRQNYFFWKSRPCADFDLFLSSSPIHAVHLRKFAQLVFTGVER